MTSSAIFRSLAAIAEGNSVDQKYHFFLRDFTYACHGAQATELATTFYKTTKVVKYEQELETLEFGTKLLGSMLRDLLAKRKKIIVWKRGANDVWTIHKKASPGNIVQIEDLLPPIDTVYNPCIASLSLCVVQDSGNKSSSQHEHIGVCIVSTVSSTMVLYNSIDISNLALLESVLVQHEVAECIFEWHNESDHSKVTTLPTSVVALDREIHSILRRQNICVAAYIGFNSAPDTDLVVSELQNLTTSSSSLTSSALANDHTSAASASVVDTFQALHATTLLAAYSVLDYLQLWKQPAGHKTFDISIGDASVILEYGSSVAEALSLFDHSTTNTDATEGGRRNSVHTTVYSLLNQTSTTMGSRRLKDWLLRPLTHIVLIQNRQQCIRTLLCSPHQLELLRGSAEHLHRFPDLEKLGLKLLRSASSVSLSDLLTLYRAVLRAQSIATLLSAFTNNDQTKSQTLCGAGTAQTAASAGGMEQIQQDLESNVSKCDKFLALIEEVVDLQRLQETYGARNSITSSNANTTTTNDTSHEAYWSDHEAEYTVNSLNNNDLFRDKWVRVRPSFTPELTALHRELQSIQTLMHSEHQRVVDLCSELDKPPAKKARVSTTITTSSTTSAYASKIIMLEHTAVHGPHFRVTKRLSNNVLKIINTSGVSAGASETASETASAKKSRTGLFGSKITASTISSGSKKEVTVLSNQKAGTLFVTPQLQALVTRFTSCKARYTACQSDVISKAVQIAATYVPVLRRIAHIIGDIDCFASLAHVALYNDWVQPTMVPSRYAARGNLSSIHTSSSGTGNSHTNSSTTTTRASAVSVNSAAADSSVPCVTSPFPSSPPALHIAQLRHPILESLLGSTHYVPSSLTLSDGYTACLLTGPNMGGKSTFMRAVAICVVLAHLGSFVPAKEAIIPIFDKLYMRIGAADCSYTGESTFMREMCDVSAILNNATASSLVLIDELGRGTSTDDGFGIAAAVLTTLLQHNRSTVLCATHFHELTSFFQESNNGLSDRVDTNIVDGSQVSTAVGTETSVSNEKDGVHDSAQAITPGGVINMHASAHVDAEKNTVTMLYEILPGPAHHSYGIHVAQAANFPSSIIEQAQLIEAQLLALSK